MLTVEIPPAQTLRFEHLVLDYNGTLAVDGVLAPEAVPLLHALADRMQIHVITADTFGVAGRNLQGVNCHLEILTGDNQDEQKRAFVEQLGAQRTVCIGNGRNDALMLKATALGICVVLAEGAAVPTLLNADVVCTSVRDALDLLLHPLRLTATLRNA